MPRPREHGTPEGYDAGCTSDVDCPAFKVHGMSCETAHLRFISGERRYMTLRGRGFTSTEIAKRLGFTPEGSLAKALDTANPSHRASIERRGTSAAQPLAERAQDPEPQKDAGAPAAEEEAPTERTPAAEGEAMGHPTHHTEKDATMTTTEDTPRDTAALVAEAIAPAIPKEPRQKPVTKPKAKPRPRPTVMPASGPSQSEVRAWARQEGLDVNAKGSVRNDVMKAYLDAHQSPALLYIAGPATTATAPAAPQSVAPPDFDEAMVGARERAEIPIPTVEEFLSAVVAENVRQVELGYDAEHDDAHGIRHLLNWSIDYSRRRKPVQAAALARAAWKALDRQELAQLNREADGEPDLPELPEEDERIKAWDEIVDHPFFKSCFITEAPLIDTMIAKLDAATDPVVLPAPDGRPEWADVTIPHDIEKARALAVRLEQELAHTETALATVVTRWWAQVEANNQLRRQLDAEKIANQVLRATDWAIAGLRRAEQRTARRHARGTRR